MLRGAERGGAVTRRKAPEGAEEGEGLTAEKACLAFCVDSDDLIGPAFLPCLNFFMSLLASSAFSFDFLLCLPACFFCRFPTGTRHRSVSFPAPAILASSQSHPYDTVLLVSSPFPALIFIPLFVCCSVCAFLLLTSLFFFQGLAVVPFPSLPLPFSPLLSHILMTLHCSTALPLLVLRPPLLTALLITPLRPQQVRVRLADLCVIVAVSCFFLV